MPLYEYLCTSCHKLTEKRQKFSDPEITDCPRCGGKLERTITAPAIQFKGGGWYADGYGNKKPAPSTEGKSEGGSSNEAASSSETKSSETKGGDGTKSESGNTSDSGKSSGTGPAAPTATPASSSPAPSSSPSPSSSNTPSK